MAPPGLNSVGVLPGIAVSQTRCKTLVFPFFMNCSFSELIFHVLAFNELDLLLRGSGFVEMTVGKVVFGQLVLSGCLHIPTDLQVWTCSPTRVSKVTSTPKVFYWLD